MLHICIQYYSTLSRYILLDVHCWWKKSCTPWVVLLLKWCSINDTFMNTYQWTRKPWKCEDEIFFSIFWLCMKSGPRDWIRCQDSHVRSTITRKRRWLNHHHQRRIRKLCPSSQSRRQKRRSPRSNPYKMWLSHWHPGWSKCHIPSYACCIIYVGFWICIACVYL